MKTKLQYFVSTLIFSIGVYIVSLIGKGFVKILHLSQIYNIFETFMLGLFGTAIMTIDGIKQLLFRKG